MIMQRRNFIRAGGVLLTASSVSTLLSYCARTTFPTVRTSAVRRRFTSLSVEDTIERMRRQLDDHELSWLFENCYPNTLDTTVFFKDEEGLPDTFVITGDINAMWLRDSSAQVMPYVALIKDDHPLQQLIAGVIRRQTKCILIDPYANAFNRGPTGSEWDSDLTDMKPELHERKWEVDSLCYPIRLAHHYWKVSGDTAPFGKEWAQAMALVVKTFKEQQRLHDKGPYFFMRKGSATDNLPNSGYGNPVKPVGLICSMFRPSDDATKYAFHIPSNFFAVVSLRQLAEMAAAILKDHQFAEECTQLAAQVEQAIGQYGLINHPVHGKMYAYEVDGLGNHLLMDDANVPNLISLPYLGACTAADPVYQASRRFALSSDNPYYFDGTAAKGLGSPHTGANNIWPLGLIMQAMTSNDEKEIGDCVEMLKTTHAHTGYMHESFNKNNPARYTRKWFAWANTLFGEMLLKAVAEKKLPAQKQ